MDKEDDTHTHTHTHTEQYYITMKDIKMLPLAIAGMDIMGIMLNVIS